MARFSCKVRDRQGIVQTSAIDSSSSEEAVRSLQAQGYLIISIDEETQAALSKAKTPIHKTKKFHSKVRDDDLILFCKQLATLLGSNVPLLKSIDIILDQVTCLPLHSATMHVKKDIEAGETLANSLKKHKKIFPELWVNMIETGEASGQLPHILTELSRYIEAASSIKRKVMSSLMYPIVLIGMATLAISVFLIKIIPTFTSIFSQFNMEFPLITKIVIFASDVLRQYYLIMIAVIAGVFIFIKQYIKTKAGRYQFDSFLLNAPMLGSLYTQILCERFSSGLATLVESGVTILHCIELMSRTIGNVLVARMLDGVKSDVKEGRPLGESLSKSPIFPSMVSQMISVGEETGQLGKMLKTVSEYYRDRVDIAVTRFAALLEPLLIVFVGLIIGVIVVAMFLPIFQMSQIAR